MNDLRAELDQAEELIAVLTRRRNGVLEINRRLSERVRKVESALREIVELHPSKDSTQFANDGEIYGWIAAGAKRIARQALASDIPVPAWHIEGEPRCSQCGEPLTAWACGPAHAIARQEAGLEWDGVTPGEPGTLPPIDTEPLPRDYYVGIDVTDEERAGRFGPIPPIDTEPYEESYRREGTP